MSGGAVDDLAGGVRLLCLDAGNTIVFLDHRACAEIVASALARSVDERALERAEGVAKRRLDEGTLLPPLPDAEITPAWGAFMSTVVQLGAGVDDATAVECTRALWREHRRFNLWRTVPAGLVDEVRAVRRAGVPVAVVSNSEGQLELLFERLGLGGEFDLVIDSHHAGVEKPDPRIFHIALTRFGVAPAATLHLGDTWATDVLGARAAGVRVALIDPFGHYEGRYADVARVDGVASVCRSIVSSLT